MGRPLMLTRDEAECLVDLIEECSDYRVGDGLADRLREQWGMSPFPAGATAKALEVRAEVERRMALWPKKADE